jgi:hypothetical protein
LEIGIEIAAATTDATARDTNAEEGLKARSLLFVGRLSSYGIGLYPNIAEILLVVRALRSRRAVVFSTPGMDVAVRRRI